MAAVDEAIAAAAQVEELLQGMYYTPNLLGQQLAFLAR